MRSRHVFARLTPRLFLVKAVNDVRYVRVHSARQRTKLANRHVTVQIEYEQLLRGLLDLPNQPAIINMQVFGLLFDPLSQGGDQVSASNALSHARY